MSNKIQAQFELTQKILQRLTELTETNEIKIDLEFDKYFGIHKIANTLVCISSDLAYHLAIDDKFEYICGKFEEPQIKDILVAFEGKLGENPEYLETVKVEKKCWGLETDQYFTEQNKLLSIGRFQGHLSFIFQSQVEALYQNWFCTWPQSLFKSNPIKVHSELLKVLESIK